MKKVTISKILYIIIIAASVATIVFVFTMLQSPSNLLFLVVICVMLLIPGRIQGYYYKDFYTARKLLNGHNYEKSIEMFNKFLGQVQNKPWIKKLIWLSWGIYTKDIESMTYNNIGAGKLYLGDLEEAKEHFNKAINLDSNYPIPYYNLAIISIVEGDKATAESYYKEARNLGFKGTSFDAFINKVQSIYANIIG